MQRQPPTRTEYTEEKAGQERTKAKQRGESVGDTLDDAWIHTKILASLATNTEAPLRGVNVDVKNSVVTLRGSVETATQRSERERVARPIYGAKAVQNQLKVRK